MKIQAHPQPMAIITSYTPLVTRFGIIATGGSKTQFFYTNEGQYIPSRAVTPLLLKAYLSVADPDGVIPTGDKSTKLSVQWYEGDYESQITEETVGYTINDDNTLIVTKDVAPSEPIQILVRASYTDTRNGNILVYEDRCNLSSISKTDSTLSLTLNKPAKVTFNPLEDAAEMDITAELRLGSKIVGNDAKYYWYVVNNGIETLIDKDENALEYISGQGTATLRINAAYTNFSLLRCRATNGELDNKSPSADIAVVYSVPQVTTYVYSPNGSTLRSSEKSKTFICKLHTTVRVLTDDEVAENFLVKWYRKPLIAGGTAMHIGDGVSISIPSTDLKLSGRQAMNVYATVYSRGAYGYLVNSEGVVITTQTGEIILTRT